MSNTKEPLSPRFLRWLMFQSSENLLFMLCGVFVSVCINLFTTIFTAEYEGIETLLFIFSTLSSAYATVFFCFLTIEILSEREKFNKEPNIIIEKIRIETQGNYIENNKKKLNSILLHIKISTVVFFIALIIGWLFLNDWLCL